jgi:hypothetical protein
MRNLSWVALLGSVGLLLGQSGPKKGVEPKFSELSREHRERLDQQRALIAAAAKQRYVRWVMITDEYGSDPTLRFKDTSININALTMISKRVERGESVDVCKLLEANRKGLQDAKERFR